jgi:hypothetical protein
VEVVDVGPLVEKIKSIAAMSAAIHGAGLYHQIMVFEVEESPSLNL